MGPTPDAETGHDWRSFPWAEFALLLHSNHRECVSAVLLTWIQCFSEDGGPASVLNAGLLIHTSLRIRLLRARERYQKPHRKRQVPIRKQMEDEFRNIYGVLASCEHRDVFRHLTQVLQFIR